MKGDPRTVGLRWTDRSPPAAKLISDPRVALPAVAMFPEATKDAQFVPNQAKTAVAKVRCVACAKSGGPAEFEVPHYERQSPRVPEIEGLYLETRKSGGPFHSCNRHKPPLVLIRWQILRNRPPTVRGSP